MAFLSYMLYILPIKLVSVHFAQLWARIKPRPSFLQLKVVHVALENVYAIEIRREKGIMCSKILKVYFITVMTRA